MDEEIVVHDKAQKDILEFIDCAKRTIKPYNTLVYKLIMGTLEMMLIRDENEEKINGVLKVLDTDINYAKLSNAEMDEIDSIVEKIQE